MEDKRSFIEAIRNIKFVSLNIIDNLVNLAKVEAELASRNTAIIIAAAFTIFILSIVTWIGLCCIISISLLYAGLSLLLSIGIVTMINIVLIGLLSYYIFCLKDALAFNATKRQLHNILLLSKGEPNE